MDFDIEMDDAVEVAHMPEAYTEDIITGEEQEPGEVDEDHFHQPAQPEDQVVQPRKLHIRGLDTFAPDDLKAYVAEHYSGDRFERVEWVDDVSANLVFKSAMTTSEALSALATVSIADPLQLDPSENIPAKSFSGKPESKLSIRLATAADKKIQGAASRSRFYLLHPEYDPEERRRRGEFNHRGSHRERDGYRDNRRRRDYRDREDDGPEASFDASLYDDDEATLAKRGERQRSPRRRRESSQDGDRHALQNRDKELFPNHSTRARNRSASPLREHENNGMEVDHLAQDRDAAVNNRDRARSIKERLTQKNGAKELFPTRVSIGGGKAQMDQVDEGTILSSAKLADRVSLPGTTTKSTDGLNIRGLANKRSNDIGGGGFAIKGAAANVRELFPGKFGNAGKELFADKLEGRGRRRQKAEDSFR